MQQASGEIPFFDRKFSAHGCIVRDFDRHSRDDDRMKMAWHILNSRESCSIELNLLESSEV